MRHKWAPFPWGLGTGGLPVAILQPPLPGAMTPGTGIPGTTVTLPGTGFGTLPGTVTINGIAATITLWTDTTITFLAPTQLTYPDVHPVVVTTYALKTDAGGAFTTTAPAPAIGNVSVSTGLPGDSITLTGSNFETAQGTGSVTFDGTAGTVTSWSDTSITVTVPSQSSYPDIANLFVNTDGALQSNGWVFETDAPGPAITDVQQASVSVGSALAGTDVTILGTLFGASQGAGTVKVHGVPASVTSWSATAIVVRLPYQSSYPDASSIVVTDNSAVASNAFSWTTSYQIDAAGFAGAGNLKRTTELAISPQAGSMAVAAWVWLDATAGAQFIGGKADTTNWEWYLWYFQASGGFRFAGFSGGASNSVVSNVTVATGAWHHVMLIWSAGTATIYVDGVSAGQNSAASGTFGNRNTCDLTMGRPMTAGAQGLSGLSGRVDNLVVWDNVTGLVVADVYNGGAGVNYGTAPAAARLHAIVWYDNNDTGWEDQVGKRDMSAVGTVTLAAGKT